MSKRRSLVARVPPSGRPAGPCRVRWRALATRAMLGVTLAGTGIAAAQPAAPEDWPCVQVLVPEIVPSVLWPVPIDESLAGTWEADPEIRVLAHRLGDLERLDEESLGAIDDYAASVPQTQRRSALTRLADGVVSVANTRRARYIDGIRRYTRQQIAIAGQIEATLNRLAELDDLAGSDRQGSEGEGLDGERASEGASEVAEGAALARSEIEETLAWHERLYDQREHAIRALCDRPVELEQTLSEVLRELAHRLPDA